MSEKLSFTTPLYLAPLLDLTERKGSFEIVRNTQFRPAPDCATSGANDGIPIFGSRYHLTGKHGKEKQVFKPFGLPVFKFKRGAPVNLTITNTTGYSVNLHWHGLNTTGDADGATETLDFGVGTYFGTEFKLTIPPVTNNSCLLWVHAHNMFLSAPAMYGGAYGSVIVVDEISEPVLKRFKYGDNHLVLGYQDLQFDPDGSMVTRDIYTDESRNPFGMINGTSCVNWYENGRAPYTTQLFHHSSKNLMKIDVFAPTDSFRYIYLGVCDRNQCIKSFYLVQSDQGFRNPIKLRCVSVSPAGRVSILVDLAKFDGGKAYLFFYNFDLTEVFGVGLGPNCELQSAIPDIENVENPTPNPTPIPDPFGNSQSDQPFPPAPPNVVPCADTNPQGDPSNLFYPPICPHIPQVTIDVPTGNIPFPKKFTIKPFLKLKWQREKKECEGQEEKCPPDQPPKPSGDSLKEVVREIRQIVFGVENAQRFAELFRLPNFERNNPFGINYISLLNPNYFYDLPVVPATGAKRTVPVRNFILNGDSCQNYQCNEAGFSCAGGNCNPLGGTEFVDGQNRVFFDLWNSEELDLNYAIEQYTKGGGYYQPDVLPGSLFKISQSVDPPDFINFQMEYNDAIAVDVFVTSPCPSYGQMNVPGDYTFCMILPPTNPSPTTNQPISKPLNLQQFVDLVNATFAATPSNVPGTTTVADLLSLDWTFFPFTMDAVKERSVTLKSVQMLINNNSPYCLRLRANWSLLQFFGKSIGAMTTPPTTSCPPCSPVESCSPSCVPYQDPATQFPTNLNANISFMFTSYATTDPENPIPICTCNGPAELIIAGSPGEGPTTVFRGFYDGFENDNLMNFSVQFDATERWVYNNLDTEDTHPFHHHLASAFSDPNDPLSSPFLFDEKTLYAPHTYSTDVEGIPPQSSLAMYIRFVGHSSENFSLTYPYQQKYLGFMYHCHFMEHHDMNMMGQYFVYRNRNYYFPTDPCLPL